MTGRRLCLGVLAVCIVIAGAVAPAGADEPKLYPFNQSDLLPFDPGYKCKAAKDNPICVARTAVACTLPGARASECAELGMTDIKIDPDPPGTRRPKAPTWQQRWSEISYLSRTDFISMRAFLFRKVSADRFIADPPLTPELIGTHEVIVYAGRYKPLDIIVGYSIFMKRAPDGWKFTSYAINVLQADPNHPHSELYADHCAVEGCDYGIRDILPAEIRYSECPQRACRYWARGTLAPETPIRKDYVAWGLAPLAFPDEVLQCTYNDRDARCFGRKEGD